MNQKGGEKIRRARGECPLLGVDSGCVGFVRVKVNEAGRTFPRVRTRHGARHQP